MSPRTHFNPAELAFLQHPPRALARVATVDATGLPHVVPQGWSFDEATGDLLLTGRSVARTKRADHVRATGVAAVAIDGVHDSGGWAPWALLVRGRAIVDDEAGLVRLTPLAITSWGLEGFLPGR